MNLDYHVEIDHHYYAVPYPLVHERLEARITATGVELFHHGQRIAAHARSFARGQPSTLPSTFFRIRTPSSWAHAHICSPVRGKSKGTVSTKGGQPRLVT